MKRTTYLVVAALVVLVALTAACSLGAPAPTPTAPPTATKAAAAPTTAPVAPTAAPAATKPAAPAAPTAAPATGGGTAAAQPTAAPKPPVVKMGLVAVPANPATDPKLVITSTIKAMTDTTAGTYSAVIALGTTGLNNVSIGVPVALRSADEDAKNPATKWTWTLTSPPGSKAVLAFTNTAMTKFTPDVVGWYKVDVVAASGTASAAMQSVQVHADTYVGVQNGNCRDCHAAKVEEWEKTGHATIFEEEVSGGADPANTHYNEGCIRCHTTGYYYDASGKAVANGGFADVQAKTGWKMPTYAEMGQKKTQVWQQMPAVLKNMGNVQCESCHGPAGEHVSKGANTMRSTVDQGVCDVCHNGGGHHLKGTEIKAAKHSEENSDGWTVPTGPARQACVRCHSTEGYITFTQDPTNMAAWSNEAGALTCTACHDPHDSFRAFQLRITGKPVQTPTDLPNMGLSATCGACHNGRTKAADAIKGSFPHYSAASEFVYNQGGVDYGQTLANSPHGQLVGAQPLKDPADKTGASFLFGGDTPGSCVACHMWPVVTDAKSPLYNKVGGHSFNTVSPEGADYLAACQSCHAGITTFNLPAKADYDGNGKVEGVQDEVKGLLGVLWKEFEAAGFKKLDNNPYITDLAKMTDKQEQAWYNFRMVYGVIWGAEGKAAAIHNFKRSVQLLQLSYKEMVGKDVPGATIMK